MLSSSSSFMRIPSQPYSVNLVQLSHVKLDRISRDPSPVDSSLTLRQTVLILNALSSSTPSKDERARLEKEERARIAQAQDDWYNSVVNGLDLEEVEEMDAIDEEEEEEEEEDTVMQDVEELPQLVRRSSTVEVVEVQDEDDDLFETASNSSTGSPTTSPSSITYSLPPSSSSRIAPSSPRPTHSIPSSHDRTTFDAFDSDSDDDDELVTPPQNVLHDFEGEGDFDECGDGASLGGLQLF